MNNIVGGISVSFIAFSLEIRGRRSSPIVQSDTYKPGDTEICKRRRRRVILGQLADIYQAQVLNRRIVAMKKTGVYHIQM